MSDPARYQADDDDLWRRLRGVQKLKGVRLQIAADLCRWREAEARRGNRPRRWIVKDEVLVEIARRQPDTLAELEQVPDLAGKTLQRHGKALLAVVAEALAVAPEAWPSHPQRSTPNNRQLALGDCLMALCRQFADDNDIALATLATRKDIDNLVMDSKTSRLAQGWRFAMAGEKLLGFIHGQSTIAVDGDRLRLIEKEPGN